MRSIFTLRSVFIAALATLAIPVTQSFAAAPQVKTSAPGFYRVMLGQFEVTALSDGTAELPVDTLLTNTTAEKVLQALKKAHQHSPLETSVNAYLINTGDKLLLIDTGSGSLFGPTLGKMLGNLKAAGYNAEQVDEIYITHMHPDHVGGLMNGETMVFPNAVVRADQHDADLFLNPANLEKAQAETKGFFQGAMASLNPYIKAGKFKAFEGDTELQPGIRAIASHGHTAGHTIYQISSQNQQLVLWGDLMHVAAVQFAEPSVTIQFETDSKAAAAERKKAYATAASSGVMIGAAHLSFPGLGYVHADKKGYAFVPLNYSPVKP